MELELQEQTPEGHEATLRRVRRNREQRAKHDAVARSIEAQVTRDAVDAGLNKSKVAKLLGVSRPTLYAILDR